MTLTVLTGRSSVIALLLLTFATISVHAQTQAQPRNGVAAAESAASFKPRAADIEPLAAKRLMLDVANTGKRLIAVGDRGHILASNDGKRWAQVPVPVRAPLTAVSFVDADYGWAVGHDAVILRTIDGGRTWNLQMFEPVLEHPFLDVLFLDRERGYAVGAYGLFYRTEDGGADWQEVKAPEVRGDELNLYSIAKLGNGSLVVAGEQGLLALSSDGGKRWKKIASPVVGTLFGIVAQGAKGAVACGLRGNAFMTDDLAGGKWKPIVTGTQASFFGCSKLDERHVALVGLGGAVLVADLSTGKTRALTSPVTSAYSSVVQWGPALVLTGEQGMQQIAYVP